MNESTITPDYMNSILSENKSLEQVNLTLLNKLQTYEEKMDLLNQSFEVKEKQIKTKDESLNKAEQIIRKLQSEIENARRNIDLNERSMKILKEQYKNLQVQFDTQEKHLQHIEYNKAPGENVKFELKEMTARMEKMRREHIMNFDVEKEKYQNLLHKYSDLEKDYQTVQLSLEAKEQECMTIESHNVIQGTQIDSLQNEISNMIDKLEDIKNSYEMEIESKDDQLQKNRTIALNQIRQMQQQQRQDSVNNQKEIMKLRDELDIKIQKREQHKKAVSMSDKKIKTQALNSRRSLSKQRSSMKSMTTNSVSARIKKSSRSNSQGLLMNEYLLQPVKSQAEQDMLVNSPLISWLKQQVQDAWLREKSMKNFINQYSGRCLTKLQVRLEDLDKQRGRVRAEVEMWQMRNEEMETRLYMATKKMWSLKQIAVEQQKQLKRQTVERQAMNQQLEAFRHISQENIILCKNHYYDIYDQLRNADGYQQISHNMSVTKDNMSFADYDRNKLIRQLESQIQISAKQRKEQKENEQKLEILTQENKDLLEHFDCQSDKLLSQIHNIFDIIDPDTSRVLVDPTVDQLLKLIQGKIGSINIGHKVSTESNLELENRLLDQKIMAEKEKERFEIIIRECQERIVHLENDNEYLSGKQVSAPLRGISSVQSMAMLAPEVDAKLKNEADLMAIENRQLRCDVSEKQIIIEELSQKNHRLQKENKECRDKLFHNQSLFGEFQTKDNRAGIQGHLGSTFQEMDSSFLNQQYSNAIQIQGTNQNSMPRNAPTPQDYPVLFSNQSQQQNVQMNAQDLEESRDENATGGFTNIRSMNVLSTNGNLVNQVNSNHSVDALSNYIAQTTSGAVIENQQFQNITLDTQKIQEAHTRHRDQLVVIQSIKEDIIDAVNDLKAKKDIWNISQKQEEKCDAIIKKMVLNARESDHIAHSYDLVRSLFDVLREVQKSKIHQGDKKQEKIEQIQDMKTDNEHKVLKNIQIVIDVFKKAAEKIGKIGERDWREVLEQQGYVLEELISIQENLQKVGASHKGYKQAQTNFGHALGDFQFCLSKALDNLVSKDVDHDQKMMGTNSLRIKTKKLDESQLKKSIMDILYVSQKKLHSDAEAQITQFMGLKGHQKLNSLLEMKQLSNKIMKSLREELACSHSIYIKRINADIIEYESNQRVNNELMRSMPIEELIKMICSLKQEILSLRINEIFMKKCSDQIKAIKSSLQICNFESFYQSYQTQTQYELPQKLLKIVNELAESIQREAKSSFAIDHKQGSLMRNEFVEQLLVMFNFQIQGIKDANSLNQTLKLAY